jgi:pimeloyl-ACP methyl ester carboxylesterase
MDGLGAWVARGLFPDDDQALLRREAARRIAGNPRRGYLQSVFAVTQFDVDARLGEIHAPTFVLAGTRDTTVPLRASRRLAAGIRGARLAVVEGAGHVASVDAASQVNTLLLEFLRDAEREG